MKRRAIQNGLAMQDTLATVKTQAQVFRDVMLIDGKIRNRDRGYRDRQVAGMGFFSARWKQCGIAFYIDNQPVTGKQGAFITQAYRDEFIKLHRSTQGIRCPGVDLKFNTTTAHCAMGKQLQG